MVEKYKAYPDYKNSGTRWMGDVPKDWSLIPLKYLCQFSGGGTPSKDSPEYWNGNIPWVSPKDMKTSRIISTIDNVTERAINESSTNLVDEGALLVVVRSGILQHSIPVAINDVPVTLNQDMKAIRFNARLNAQYAMYVTIGSQAALLLEWRKQGATVESIEQEYLANTVFPVPPVNEQDKITKFLDVETAKIDTLIEKQQQLIHLLKEKRQAVINHAVTKGLNPNAKMRDSGIEWLGEVPEHWALSQPRYACSFVGGGTPTKENLDFWGGDIPWVSPKDMKQDYLSSAQDTITPAALSHSAVKLIDTGAVLIVVRGMILDHSVPVALSEVKLTINQDMKALIPNSKLDGEYLLYCLKGMRDNILDLVESSAHGTKCLRTEQFDRMVLPLPPLNEQLKIIAQLKDTLGRIDKLTSNTELMIGLAIERRTALISAAVTGKIDVRNWIAPQAKLIDKEVAA